MIRSNWNTLAWAMIVAAMSMLTFIGNFIFLKYSIDPSKVELAYNYNLCLYIGGLLAILIYNGFRLEESVNGRDYTLKKRYQLIMVFVVAFVAEKIAVICTILRFGVVRQGVALKFSVLGFVFFSLCIVIGLICLMLYPELAWRYFLGWLSLLPVFGLVAFTTNGFWLPSASNFKVKNLAVLWRVAKRTTFDLTLILTPFSFLFIAESVLKSSDLAIYLEALAAFGVCGVITMIIESQILKSKFLGKKFHTVEPPIWLFSAFMTFLIIYIFFSRSFLISVLCGCVSLVLMLGGALTARLRKVADSTIFIKQSVYMFLICSLICISCFFWVQSIDGFLSAFLLCVVLNAVCYKIGLESGNI